MNFLWMVNDLQWLQVVRALTCSALVPLLVYVFTALSLYTMASHRGIHSPWLAWIPVVNLWILGSLSDQYHYVVRGEDRAKRKILLCLRIAKMVIESILSGLAVSMLITVFSMGVFNGNMLMEQLAARGLTLVALLLPLTCVAIAYAVVRFMALYDVYRSCDPSNAVAYLVLAILIPLTVPILLFVCRNQEKGMPARTTSFTE